MQFEIVAIVTDTVGVKDDTKAVRLRDYVRQRFLDAADHAADVLSIFGHAIPAILMKTVSIGGRFLRRLANKLYGRKDFK